VTTPRISVCLPNLNTLPFLAERVDTILGQTYKEWELIVSDNFSDDGAWPFFQRLARQDRRVSIAQAPRLGLYANWNNCIERARGEYVYIATSDDTMAPDCLEKMVGALETHTSCDLAHCPLVFIDQNGAKIGETQWPDCAAFAKGLGEIAFEPHIRRAPYNGLVQLIGELVVSSITQLLIRRSLFSRIGVFSPRWGSLGDLNWEMKAGLVADMIHVPNTWASWRMHAVQATASVDWYKPERDEKHEEMIEDALVSCEQFLDPKVVEGLRSRWKHESRAMRQYYAALRHRGDVASRRRYQMNCVLSGSRVVRKEILRRMFNRPRWPDVAPVAIRCWLEAIGLGPVIERLPQLKSNNIGTPALTMPRGSKHG
jgi:glycosyltransferase involved in cell wall biosynthesis